MAGSVLLAIRPSFTEQALDVHPFAAFPADERRCRLSFAETCRTVLSTLTYRSGRLSTHVLVAALIKKGFHFSITNEKLADRHVILAHFHQCFPGAFKTREAESGDHGTILALQLTSLPQGAKIYVTAHEIPRASTINAQAISADPNGRPIAAAPVVDFLPWLGAQICELPPTGLAAWEIVSSPILARELVFGIIVKGEIEPGSGIVIRGILAPSYITAAAHGASGTLPVPRFAWGSAPVNASLD